MCTNKIIYWVKQNWIRVDKPLNNHHLSFTTNFDWFLKWVRKQGLHYTIKQFTYSICTQQCLRYTIRHYQWTHSVIARYVGFCRLDWEGWAIMATSMWAKAPLPIRSILPPPPSSAGVPRTVSCVHKSMLNYFKKKYKKNSHTQSSPHPPHTQRNNFATPSVIHK